MPRRRHGILTAAAALLWACAVAGCGSADTTAQFKAGYDAARGPLNRTFDEVNMTLAGARGTSAERIAGRVAVLATRFGGELAPLDALTPPAGAATAFTTLTSSLTRVERDLRGISAAAHGRDLAGAQLAVEQLASDAHVAAQAAAVVKQKLYAR